MSAACHTAVQQQNPAQTKNTARRNLWSAAAYCDCSAWGWNPRRRLEDYLQEPNGIQGV